jgi:hypothetical protein
VPLTPEDQGGGALTGGLSERMIARSEQLRDRLATFGQKGCTDVRQCFELFNEQLVINHE